MKFEEYVNWLNESKKDYEIAYKQGKPYSLTAHLTNQFGEEVIRTFYAFYYKDEITLR